MEDIYKGPKRRGHLQDDRGVRHGDHLPPHKYIRTTYRDFPCGPVVKTSPSSVGGTGSIPGRGAKIPHVLGPKKTYFYMWNNSYRTPAEHWQKTSDFPKGKKLPTYLGRAKEKTETKE